MWIYTKITLYPTPIFFSNSYLISLYSHLPDSFPSPLSLLSLLLFSNLLRTPNVSHVYMDKEPYTRTQVIYQRTGTQRIILTPQATINYPLALNEASCLPPIINHQCCSFPYLDLIQADLLFVFSKKNNSLSSRSKKEFTCITTPYLGITLILYTIPCNKEQCALVFMQKVCMLPSSSVPPPWLISPSSTLFPYFTSSSFPLPFH